MKQRSDILSSNPDFVISQFEYFELSENIQVFNDLNFVIYEEKILEICEGIQVLYLFKLVERKVQKSAPIKIKKLPNFSQGK